MTRFASIPHARAAARADTDRPAEAAQHAIEALAARGISAHIEEDNHNSWLVVGRGADTDPHALLCLYRGNDDHTAVLRVPDPDRDDWYAATVVNGVELQLMIRPAAQLGDCVEAIAAWLADLRPDPRNLLN
ncbi:hypothetical protein GTY62_00075 [Streptomyces sp. SID724]|uniref:hypothetical protein n=1 Tax=Streptomyces sp. SID724 TaxID=2690324 RepID=UPI001361475D|nr:hypothetical protein [Streptomyces sp. SID724]